MVSSMRRCARNSAAPVSTRPLGSLAAGRASLSVFAIAIQKAPGFSALIAEGRRAAKAADGVRPLRSRVQRVEASRRGLTPPASKPIAQAKAERVQALVLGGRGSVGNMLEEQGDAVVLGQAVAELGVGMEQHAPAQLLELRIARERLAVMDGDAQ